MKKLFILFAATATLMFGDYKVEKAGAPPDGLAPAVKAVLAPEGTKLVDDSGKEWCEIWFRKSVPAGPTSSEQDATISEIPGSALVGALKFPEQGADRRGQPIKPGVYTLRYALQPIDGAHQGTAFQRDFLLMIPAAIDTDPNALPSWAEVVAMSKKAATHPAVLEMWKDDAPDAGPIEVMEGHDWVLHAKIGDVPVAVILVGKTAH